MRALLPSRRRSRVLGAVLVAVLALLLAWPVPARAANTTIEVANTEDGAFAPAEVTVEAGDTVTWEWTANEPHSVRFPEHPDMPSEDADCVPNPLTDESCEGHTYRIRFDEVGTYPFRDGATGSEGSVEVVEQASAPPKPTPAPDPTSEPEPSEPEPEPTSEPESSPEPASEPEPEPSPEPATTSEPPPPAGTAAPPTVEEESTSPTESSPDEPTVAGAASPSPVPEPTFEDFPEAVDPTPGEDVEGDVALDLPDDGGDDSSRTVWGVVGGVTLLGTLGAFGRRVLFADPWDG